MSFVFDKKNLEKNEKHSVEGDVVYEYNGNEFLDDLTDEEKKALQVINEKKEKFIESAALFGEQHTVEEMTADKEIKSITYKFPMGDKKAKATMTFNRSQTFTNRLSGDVQEVTKSKVKVVVTEPYSKISNKFLDEMEKRLSDKLLK